MLKKNEKSLKKQTKSEPVEYNGPEVVIGAEQIPAGSYVYFGADYTPYKWRVLDNEANERLFLLSDVGFYPQLNISQGTAWGNSALRQRMLDLIATDIKMEKRWESLIKRSWRLFTIRITETPIHRINYSPCR